MRAKLNNSHAKKKLPHPNQWGMDEWLGPPCVETPTIIADLIKYFDPEFNQSKYDAMPPDYRRKLQVLTERLEFIEHLQNASRIILSKQKKTKKVATIDGDKYKVIESYSAVIGGHDFAGFDFDTDALNVYLLLTCVDTLKGETKYLDAFDWLKTQDIESPLDWEKLRVEYNKNYGPTKKFLEAFTKDLSQGIKDELTNNLAVVKVRGQTIKPESLKTWRNLAGSDKLKKIAKKLWEIRSKFTHASLRTFSPEIPVRNLLDVTDDVLLRRSSSPKLQDMLKDAIRDLMSRLLIK